MRIAGLSALLLITACARQPDVAAGRFEVRLEGAVAETFSGTARFCPGGIGGTVSLLSDDGRFGLQLHAMQLAAGRALIVDVRDFDPEQPRSVGVDLFIPGGEPYAAGGTLRITAADPASVRGSFRISTRDTTEPASASAPSVAGSFYARRANDCG
jgi:hypothetical protein